MKQLYIPGILLTVFCFACHKPENNMDTGTKTDIPDSSYSIAGLTYVVIKNNISTATVSTMLYDLTGRQDYVNLSLSQLPEYINGNIKTPGGNVPFGSDIIFTSFFADTGIYPVYLNAETENKSEHRKSLFNIVVNPTVDTDCIEFIGRAMNFAEKINEPGRGAEFMYDSVKQQIYISQMHIYSSGMNGVGYKDGPERIIVIADCNQRIIDIPAVEITGLGYEKNSRYLMEGSGTINPADSSFAITYSLTPLPPEYGIAVNTTMIGKMIFK